MYEFLQDTVAQAMSAPAVSVTPRTTLAELADEIGRTDYNGYPVLQDGRLVGIVTQYDFLRAFQFQPNEMVPRYHEILQRTVEPYFTRAPACVVPSMALTKALEMIVSGRVKSLPVLDEQGALVGMLSRGDIVRRLRRRAGGG